MKKVIVTALIGLTILGFTGCTSINDTISNTVKDAKNSVTNSVESAKNEAKNSVSNSVESAKSSAIKGATKKMKCATGKCGK